MATWPPCVDAVVCHSAPSLQDWGPCSWAVGPGVLSVAQTWDLSLAKRSGLVQDYAQGQLAPCGELVQGKISSPLASIWDISPGLSLFLISPWHLLNSGYHWWQFNSSFRPIWLRSHHVDAVPMHASIDFLCANLRVPEPNLWGTQSKIATHLKIRQWSDKLGIMMNLRWEYGRTSFSVRQTQLSLYTNRVGSRSFLSLASPDKLTEWWS